MMIVHSIPFCLHYLRGSLLAGGSGWWASAWRAIVNVPVFNSAEEITGEPFHVTVKVGCAGRCFIIGWHQVIIARFGVEIFKGMLNCLVGAGNA